MVEAPLRPSCLWLGSPEKRWLGKLQTFIEPLIGTHGSSEKIVREKSIPFKSQSWLFFGIASKQR